MKLLNIVFELKLIVLYDVHVDLMILNILINCHLVHNSRISPLVSIFKAIISCSGYVVSVAMVLA